MRLLFPSLYVLTLLHFSPPTLLATALEPTIEAQSCGKVIGEISGRSISREELLFSESGSSLFDLLREIVSNPEKLSVTENRDFVRGLLEILAGNVLLARDAEANKFEPNSTITNLIANTKLNYQAKAWLDNLTQKFNPTPEEVTAKQQALFDDYHKQFSAPQQYQVRVIVRPNIDPEAFSTLTALREELVAGNVSPIQAVHDHSIAPSALGDGILAWSQLEKLPTPMRPVVPKMKEGDWSEVVTGKSALYLIQLVGKKAIERQPLEAFKANARDVLFAEYRLRVEGRIDNKSDEEILKIRADLARANNVQYDTEPACLETWITTAQLAERWAEEKAQRRWFGMSEQEQMEYFNKNQSLFPNAFRMKRKQYYLRAINSETILPVTVSEAGRIWREELGATIAAYHPGLYQEPPIPAGWELFIRIQESTWFQKPSAETDKPVTAPKWIDGSYQAEGDITITRDFGGTDSDQPYLTWDQVELDRRTSTLIDKLKADIINESVEKAKELLIIQF